MMALGLAESDIMEKPPGVISTEFLDNMPRGDGRPAVHTL